MGVLLAIDRLFRLLKHAGEVQHLDALCTQFLVKRLQTHHGVALFEDQISACLFFTHNVCKVSKVQTGLVAAVLKAICDQEDQNAAHQKTALVAKHFPGDKVGQRGGVRGKKLRKRSQT